MTLVHQTHPPQTNATADLCQSVAMLIQEWLTISQFHTTLKCFAEECHTKKNTLLIHALVPTDLKMWTALTQQLDLHSLTSIDSIPPPPSSLLERLVQHHLNEREREKRGRLDDHPSTVYVSKRSLASTTVSTSEQLKFASKRSLPLKKHPATLKGSASTSILRPHSAAVCMTTSDLIHRTIPISNSIAQPSRSNEGNNKFSTTSTPVIRAQSPKQNPQVRPASAMPQTPHRDPTIVPKPHISETNNNRHNRSPPKPKRSSDQTDLIKMPNKYRLGEESTGESNMKELKEGARDGSTNSICAADFDDTANVLVHNLEEMNEEVLTEHFSSLSRTDIKKLRRVLAKSSAHSMELRRCQTAMDKINARVKNQEHRSVFASEQTALLSTTMNMLTKEPCGLCHYIFLKKNMKTRVSYKSIYDLRASWTKKETHSIKSGMQPTRHGHENDEDENQQESNLETLDSSQISHLYDEVPVCIFCEQLVLNLSSYRPSSAEQKKQKNLLHTRKLNRQKQKIAQRLHDQERCDPYTSDSLYLNSDDEATDEVIVVDAIEGRQHVVRYSTKEQTRAPTQLGLVSKKLHYEKLRSNSMHALNKKEWDIIVNGNG